MNNDICLAQNLIAKLFGVERSTIMDNQQNLNRICFSNIDKTKFREKGRNR